ncbi:MAG: hypothetical protein GY863_18925 [bacterium]|nr:hypothetical protein [bacterium]
MGSDKTYKTFLDKLRAFRFRELVLVTSVNAVKFIIAAGSILVILSFIESLIWFSSSYRLILSLIIVFSCISLLVVFGHRPLRAWSGKDRNYSFESLSFRIGETFPEIRDRLLNAIQVFKQMQDNREQYSSALAVETMNRAGDKFVKYDFNKSVDLGILKKQLKLFLTLVIVSLLLSVLSSGNIAPAFVRLLNPSTVYPVPSSFTISVTPGDSEILRNDPFEISVRTDGKKPLGLYIFTKKDGEEYEENELAEQDDGTYNFRMEKARDSFTYFIRGREKAGLLLTRNIDSDNYYVNVIHRPLVRKIKIHLDYPEYSGLGSRYLEDNIGDIAALKGTLVSTEIAFNKNISEGRLRFSDNSEIPLQISDISGKAAFTISSDEKYFIDLTDENGITNSDPIEYRITCVNDDYPYIQNIVPGENSDLTEDKRQFLGFRVGDDFGVKNLRIGYTIVDRGEAEEVLTPENLEKLNSDYSRFEFLNFNVDKNNGVVQDIYHLWDLKNVSLFPEDQILYFGEVADNDGISGPKRSRTGFYIIRYPSLEELFSEAAQVQEQQEEEVSEILRESRELAERLKDLSHDFETASELEWEKQKAAEEAAKKQQELKQRLDKIGDKIEELVEKFEANDLLSAETLDKYKELQDLMKDINSTDLNSVMERLQRSMEENTNLNQSRQDVNELKNLQEDFMEKLDRTLNIMKRLQVEQMIDEVVIKAENIRESQQNINSALDTLDNMDPERNQDSKDRLSRQEDDLAGSMDNLKDTIDRLQEKMIDQPDVPSEDINNTRELIENKQIAGKMRELSSELPSQNTERSSEKGKEIENDLSEVEQNLKNADREISQDQKDQIVSDIRNSVYDMLELSKDQENIKQQTRNLTVNSDKFTDVAANQHDLLSGLERTVGKLVKLSEITFFLTPELGGHLTGASTSMGDAIFLLEQRNSNATRLKQQLAMSSINESIMELRKSLDQAKQSGTGMGFEEFMKKMEQLSQQQSQINQETMSMPQQGGLSPQQQAALERLIREQQMLQRSLDQLKQDMQGSGSMKDRLGELTNEMKDVIDDMKESNISDQTTELQEKILSRMLDAQKSIHRRDFSNKRMAEAANEYNPLDPGKLPDNLGEYKNFLEEELLKALKEGYNRDFEDLIKKYFENLNKKMKKKDKD